MSSSGSAHLKELAVEIEGIFPPAEVTLPRSDLFTNADPDFEQRLLRPAYDARIGHPSEVDLVRLPRGTMVYGKGLFITAVGNTLIHEQMPPSMGDDTSSLQVILADTSGVIDVEEPALLLARFGERTWGHWLCELLPKAAVCERYYPGRFRYVVPEVSIDRGLAGVMADRVLESLSAYDISVDRLVPIKTDSTYRFSALYAITPVWSDMMMHPDVLRVMEDDVRTPGASAVPTYEKVALFRGDNDRRQIANKDEVRSALHDAGFEMIEIGLQSFEQQVAIFRRARTVFSILGSTLSGLVYSPRCVGVVAAAPARFGDRFFYALMQMKSARYAEVRGPVVTKDPTYYRDSSFGVPVGDLKTALAVVDYSPAHADVGRSDTSLDRKSSTTHSCTPVGVYIDHEAPALGDSLTAIPWMLEVARLNGTEVHVTGRFNKSLRPLVRLLPLRFSPVCGPGPVLQYRANVRAAWDAAGPRGLHMAQGHFLVAGMRAPELPITLPLVSEPSTLRPGFVFAPFSASEQIQEGRHAKMWPAERWRGLARHLRARFLRETVYLLGGPNDDPEPYLEEGTVPMLGKPLPQVLHLIRSARLFVSIDNGLSHLAHFAGVGHHLLLYPEITYPALVTNPRARVIRAWPSEITIDEVAACAEEMVASR
jgi:Glycosyltransferase 61/Glycosyltransferase family 9 (heptosyltransferase)